MTKYHVYSSSTYIHARTYFFFCVETPKPSMFHGASTQNESSVAVNIGTKDSQNPFICPPQNPTLTHGKLGESKRRSKVERGVALRCCSYQRFVARPPRFGNVVLVPVLSNSNMTLALRDGDGRCQWLRPCPCRC